MTDKATAVVGPRDFPDPKTSAHITYNPTFDELRSFSTALETTTEYGSPSYVSDFRSRSSDQTKNAVDDTFTGDDYEIIESALSAVREGETEFVCVDRMVGRHPETSFCCRLFVPKKYGRIALAWAKLLEPAGDVDPDFVTVQLPDRDEVAIRVLPEEGITAVMGSDYTGEAKKSFLRLYMYRAKQRGGLGLHAGSKRVHLETADGDRRDVGQVFLGLSGTGKSTLTSHGFWLESPEYAEMLQDDVCALLPDGTVSGSEGNGLYIKTIGLERDQQPELYHAATDESAVLENVAVDEGGAVDFDDDRYTTNGRAVIHRDCLDSASEDIDLEQVDQVFFITRNPLMPPISKLTNEQAAAAFMLGESVQTSAGDPSRAGEAIRVVGTNPFIIGSEGEEGNIFRDLIADLGVECFVLNTGCVGTDDPCDVGVEETVTLLTEVARGRVEWTDDETLGLTIPASVPCLDLESFYVPDNCDDFESAVAEMRAERRAYLDGFANLDESIKNSVY